MDVFILETLKPEIFWNALAAIGTLLAVAVALFLPTFNQYLRNNRIERLLKAEVQGNLKIIKNMTSQESRHLPGGQEISASMNNNALVLQIDIHLWHQFRYELAGERPESFEKFSSVFMRAESIIGAPSEPAQLRLLMQCDAAQSYVSKCEESGIA